MKILKSLFLLSAFLFIFSSCSDDDDNCIAPTFKENIVGTWNINYALAGFSRSGTGTFNSDSTFSTSPADLLVGNSGEEKTYVIIDNNITFRSKSGGLTNLLSGTAKTNECKKLVIEATGFGTDLNFTR